MKFWIKFLLPLIVGIIAVTLVDTQGFLASEKYNFCYNYLIPVSLLIYFFTSFWISKLIKPIYGVVAVGLIGFYDSTVGWDLQMKLDTNLTEPPHPLIWILTVIFLTLFAALIGRIAGWFAIKFSKNY